MQERQLPKSDLEALAPAEQAALRRFRARRLKGLLAGAGAVTLTLFGLGCPEPADLQNPSNYAGATSTGGSGTTAGTSAGGTGGSGMASCEVQCVNDIFQKSPTLCALCHNNEGLKSAMLDVKSPGYTARLKDVPATHGDLGTGMTAADCPKGDKLIDSSNAANSWLLKKIEGKQGNCGTPMPSTGMLTADQKTCLETYINCVAGGSMAGGGSASGGSASGGGSGGAASGGGGTGGAASGGGGAGGTATGGGGGTGGT